MRKLPVCVAAVTELDLRDTFPWLAAAVAEISNDSTADRLVGILTGVWHAGLKPETEKKNVFKKSSIFNTIV